MKVFSLLKKANRCEITEDFLVEYYFNKKWSTSHIARYVRCSENKINYWLAKYEIKKRTISDAIYELKNPLGDPFLIKQPQTLEQGILFGLGLGIYWGEGLKRGKGAVRLTNTDPKMVKKFIDFLEKFCGVDKNKLRFSLQIFSDIFETTAIKYWMKELDVKKEQFYKTIISEIRGKGTYKYKSEYGVIIVYFNNVKLKKIILEMIEKV